MKAKSRWPKGRQMSDELTQKLYAAFPRLYSGHDRPPSESSMCWGFECGDGWYQLLYDLSKDLTDYMEQNPSINLEVMQVKSKFGSLRFHLDEDQDDEVTRAMIDRAKERARFVCQDTGLPLQDETSKANS
jgi:hypothetical protein